MMDENKLLEMLYSEGKTKGQIESLLMRSLELNHLKEVGVCYANFKKSLKDNVLEKLDTIKEAYRSTSHLKSVEIEDVLNSWESFSSVICKYKLSDSYTERKAIDNFGKVGLNGRFLRDHQFEKPHFMDFIDDMNLSHDYNIRLNCENLYFDDCIEEWKLFVSSTQIWAHKDDLNWVVVCKDILLVAIEGKVLFLESDSFTQNYFDDDREFLKLSSGHTRKCLALGMMYYKDNFERWGLDFIDDDIYGLMVNPSNNNYREIVKPYKPYDDGHVYVDSHGYIDGELSYISLKDVFPQYYEESRERDQLEPCDIRKGGYHWLYDLFGFRNFKYHNPGGFILSKGDTVMPEQGMLNIATVPHENIFTFKRHGMEHVLNLLNANGHEIESPRSQFVTGIYHSKNLSFFANVKPLADNKQD